MRIPADSILLEGDRIEIDQSELTGESEERTKRSVNHENQMNGADAVLLSRCLVKTG